MEEKVEEKKKKEKERGRRRQVREASMLVARRLLPPLLASLTAVTVHVPHCILMVVYVPVLFVGVGISDASHRICEIWMCIQCCIRGLPPLRSIPLGLSESDYGVVG